MLRLSCRELRHRPGVAIAVGTMLLVAFARPRFAKGVGLGVDVPLDNAVYIGDGEQAVLLGQGTHADYAYDGDIVYHELGHGVVDALVGEHTSLNAPVLGPHSVSRQSCSRTNCGRKPRC